MGRFATFGNELYSGRRSIDFVGKRRIWYSIALVTCTISLIALFYPGLNPGIEFRGGSEFRISKVANTDTIKAGDIVKSAAPEAGEPLVSKIGRDGLRIQTDRLSDEQTEQVAATLAKSYDVPTTNVTASFVGPSWGRDVSTKAIQGLVAFLILVAAVISIYFRTWKMAAAALVALVHDLVITVGVYALAGFEVTPSSVIGFLTILGYSLYDTVVVFDKVRENTEHITTSTRRTYAEAANLAVNQTLVRSINTSVVALLPVGSILFIGAFLLGAGTLRDLSLSLFVGIAAGTYSSIFIATPLLVSMRMREEPLRVHAEKLLKRRAEKAPAEALVGVGAGSAGPAGEPEAEGPAGAGVPTTVRTSSGRALGEPDGPQRRQPKRSTRANRGPNR
ncbi:protein translocase subunit SecF [Spongisporangium articulatum]|uniref:Protein-export membrane protein SecF n=1 Tax=Spongisporangium articulatum TaxID=3362603 RepID=A0ABW8ASJ8_9ACTN